MLSAIEDEKGARFPDTHDGGVRGYVPKPAALGGEVAVDEHSHVLAWRAVAESAEFPDGVEPLAEAAIPGSTAPPNTPYLIEVPADALDAHARADGEVVEAATNLQEGEAPVTAVLPFLHPLLLEADGVAITATGEEAGMVVANEARRADLAEEDADGWKSDVRRMAEDFNANLARALEMRDELSWRRREGP